MPKAAATPLGAELLGMPKGAAIPTSDPDHQPVTPPHLPRRAAIVETTVEEVPRTALTVRLPRDTLERLREAAHRTRAEKQAIVDEALSNWLDNHNF